MKDLKISTFIDQNIFKFPPNIPNATFYQDPFFLENVETGMSATIPPKDEIDIWKIKFNDKKDYVNIQLLPVRNTMYTDQVYIPVRHTEPVIINIPGTSLVMRKDSDSDYLGWVPRLSSIEENQNTFKIHPIKSKKGIELVNYDEDVYITYQDIYIVEYVEEYNIVKVVYTTYEKAKSEGRNVTFRLRPNIQSYYCKDFECHPIELKDVKMNGLEASYKGNNVTRNPQCWGMCNYRDSKRKESKFIIVYCASMYDCMDCMDCRMD